VGPHLQTDGAAKTRNWIVSRLHLLRVHLDEHILFWFTFLFALYVFFFVPQIRNVWLQQPPTKGGVRFAYVLFLIYLTQFYLLSMFAVVRQFPIQWIQAAIERLVDSRMRYWREKGRRRFVNPLYWAGVLTFRLPDLCSRWLPWTVSNPSHTSGWTVKGIAGLSFCVVGAMGLFAGTRGDASQRYPLAGAFCQNLALLCLLSAIWLTLALQRVHVGLEGWSGIGVYFGRFLGWLFATYTMGELLWIVAGTNWRGDVISYRIYTIWAVFQILTSLVILGLLIDRWHTESKVLPVRQIALIGLPLFVWLFSRALPVEPSDLDRFLSRSQAQVWQKLVKDSATGPNALSWYHKLNQQWFDQMEARLEAIDAAQPVVLVAASGGGSRAAIYSSLVLETLERTPIDVRSPIADAPAERASKTWFDNIVLISSVSGGSLGAGFHVEKRKKQPAPEVIAAPAPGEAPTLLNTSALELKLRGEKHLRELIHLFLSTPPADFPQGLLKEYYKSKEHTIAESVAALEGAERELNDLLEADTQARKGNEDTLTSSESLPPEKALQLGRKISQLNEEIAALRNASAFLTSLHALKDERSAEAGKWIWSSRAFDEMCIDFMAPIMRGALTPALDRGDALAHFWSNRFDWKDCTNVGGYHEPLDAWNYRASEPAIIFNAVDVARGSRLAIGFPPLPSDLWDGVYQKGATHEPPHCLNFAVSLARAIRMSSNFPYGFRAMEVAVPSQVIAGSARKNHERLGDRTTIHILDGGVLDNTGLDTLYELFLALEFHAAPGNASGYQQRAARVLDSLRGHGVCLVEIDAGAKPNTGLPARLDPFGGIKEQSQALENGGYSNADRAKQLYVNEIRRILNQRFDGLGAFAKQAGISLQDLEEFLQHKPTVFHYHVQCNHYQPGQSADPAIMTAWALGPRDKAEVVARFLPDLVQWNPRRIQLVTDIQLGKKAFEAAQHTAKERAVNSVITAVKVLTDRITLHEKQVQNQSINRMDAVAELRKDCSAATERLEALAKAIHADEDPEFHSAVAKLQTLLKDDDQRIALLEKAPTAASIAQLQADLRAKPIDLAQSTLRQLSTSVEANAREAKARLSMQMKRSVFVDPQSKYDAASRQTKQVFERGNKQQDK
jgi:hypothetical protein